MPDVISIRFKPGTKIYYFDPKSLRELKVDDRVIVQTSRGIEMGVVVKPSHRVPKNKIKGKLKGVVRKATPVDLLEAEKYKARSGEALQKCNELIKEMNIPIKAVNAEYNFDGSRLLFSFTAEQRIDFRELVKELTNSLKTRIEMRQMGARDETKTLDGYGRCGRRLCCASWLTEFHPVSIKMAKQQNLPLAPSEISGLCGRLLCCLAYENKTYVELKKKLPRVGSQVETEQGLPATVRGLNIIKGTVLLTIEGGDSYVEVQADAVKPFRKEARPLRKEGKPPKKDEEKEKKKGPARKTRRTRRRR